MRITTGLATAAILLALGGCARTAPIFNVDNAPVTSGTAKTLTAPQVRASIIAAGTSLGWRIADAGPGMLEGTLSLRTHTAVVEIPYSASAYSIKHKRTENLHEMEGRVHSNYNGWVQNLDRAIRTEMARM